MFIIAVLLLCIIIGYPIWDYLYMKHADFSNNYKMYWTIIIPQWIFTGVFLIYFFATKRSIKDLFIVSTPILHDQSAHLKQVFWGVLSTIAIFGLIFLFSKKLKQNLLSYFERQMDSIRFMLPSTFGERLLFALVALTAGFCEEVVFRGVMLYYFNHIDLQLSIIPLMIVMSLLFGIVHLYQGWKGVVGTAYMGGALLYVYLATGNLWICILIHFLIDVKFVFTSNKKPASSQEVQIPV
ncbi:CPBP family intramembrane glutamic endopeptidase [Falsibacillus albus]|uniref:CPBP family intramembrane metalloprotease n=1 Tax=Falsibacillus albus TaxID=2478915 RepID=A0A3L7JVQ6_9BACI|nr:CPBP family intramembrane glutamic endopeptidase [Falsibacillus albus]RLQ94620.1 CPBP family intramembrane metalloprotease [Falsibacillus albus]